MNTFSLNDSHAFNRANHTYTQHWQRDAVSRWNLKQKASRTSLPLPRLHSAFLFVLCASVAVEVTQLSRGGLFRSSPEACGRAHASVPTRFTSPLRRS